MDPLSGSIFNSYETFGNYIIMALFSSIWMLLWIPQTVSWICMWIWSMNHNIAIPFLFLI